MYIKSRFLNPLASILLVFFMLICILPGVPVYASAAPSAADGTTTVWDTDQVLVQKGAYDFAGIYEFDNLTIKDNVTIYSKGISQLVIKVKGTLTLGKNVRIRVRNGFYEEAPNQTVSLLTEENLNSLGIDAGGFRVYEKMYGKGGNGGDGGSGVSTAYASSGGGGGGGGFGGGVGGKGGAAGYGTKYNASPGTSGSKNGSYGGNAGAGGYGGTGGKGTAVGEAGENGSYGGNGGGGGGGNGGDGGTGVSDVRYAYLPYGGSGGGGGGYGGGILTLIADKIVYDGYNPPQFLVSGQMGGKTGQYRLGTVGQNGEGGLLIIQCPDYIPSPKHWKLDASTFGTHSTEYPSYQTNGGHGIVTGNPQKVFINGKEIDSSDITPPTVTNTAPKSNETGIGKGSDIVISFSEAISKGVNFNDISLTDAKGNVINCSCSINDNILTLTHDNSLELNTVYTVKIPVGAVIDKVGYTIETGCIFSFTTEVTDVTPPTVKSVDPAGGSNNAGIDGHIAVKFSEAVKAGENFSRISLKRDDGSVIGIDSTISGSILDIRAKTSLAYGRTYTLSIPAGSIQDLSGNICNTNYNSAFTTLVKATGISITPESMVLTAGGGKGLIDATVLPSASSNKQILWTSSNTSAATVSDGQVTPVSPGSAVISATTADGGFTGKCTVTVKSADSKNVVWNTNQVLGQKGAKNFAGVYEFDSLTIGDNVQITNSGTSQLIIKVNGTLSLGKNATIRVRNGFYTQSPLNSIGALNSANLANIGEYDPTGGWTFFENMFGKGGNGGNGGNGGFGGSETRFIGYGTYMYISGMGGNGGGGGGGGYGGGIGGNGGSGGGHAELINADITGANGKNGSKGQDNGGDGGIGVAGLGGKGGGASNVGSVGNNGGWNSIASGGGGGGGNGAAGYSGDARSATSVNNGDGGGGGGAGGYGGGVLTIIADRIDYDRMNPPKFIVCGQQGGPGGSCGSNASAGSAGQSGQGGLLIIQSPDYLPSSEHWSLAGTSYGMHDSTSSNGGHGIATGDPQKVFVNGNEIQLSDRTAPAVTNTTPSDGSLDTGINQPVTVTFTESVLKVDSTADDNILLINKGNNLPVDCNVIIDKNKLTLQPKNALNYSTEYEVSIKSGSIMDYSGNKLLQDYHSGFRTISASGPMQPKGSLDTPKAGQTVSGICAVKGWFLDVGGVSKIEVLVDGTVKGSAVYGEARTDIGTVFPEYRNSNCGFSYSLDTSKLTNGSHNIVIRETSGAGKQTSLAARSVTVANALPAKGALDTPKAGQTVSGICAVKGWFLDGSGVSKVEVLVDGTVKGTAAYGQARTDIGTAFPDYKSTNCGYSYSLDTTKLTNGNHSIVIRETSGTGTQTSLAARSVTVSNALPSKGALDTPKAGQTVSGICAVKGWFLDGSGVSKVEVLVDGTVKGTAAYGQARTDISTVFPDYKNSNCGYSYSLDTTKLTNGSHSIVIRETSSTGTQTNLAVRSVTVSNALPAKGALDTPKAGQTTSGICVVKGWFLDGSGVSKVEVLVDGAAAGTAAYGSARTDIGTVFPDYKNTNCGYSYNLDTTKLSNGSHSIVIRETGVNGAQTSLAARSVTVSNALPAKGALDTPKAGQTVSGTCAVKGWFLDGSGVSKVEVLVDGTVKGTAAYGSARADIGTVFPDYKNTNCGYSYNLDTTKLSNGSHSIVIRETGINGAQTSLTARSITVSN